MEYSDKVKTFKAETRKFFQTREELVIKWNIWTNSMINLSLGYHAATGDLHMQCSQLQTNYTQWIKKQISK